MEYTQYSQGYGGYPPQNDPIMMINEQKKAEKHGIFVAAAKLGALLLIYEGLTYAMNYAYYYVLYFVKAGKFTTSFSTVRDYFRSDPGSISSSFYNMLGNLFIVVLSMVILMLLAILVFKVKLKDMLKPEARLAGAGVKWFSLSMSVNIAVSIVVSILVSIMSTAGITVPEQDFSMTDSSAGTLIMQFTYVILIGPICEELLYRGVIISLLKPYGKGLAVFFSAFLFGYMHGNIPQFASAFAGGLVFAAIAVKYDSLVPTIVMHIMNNTIASIKDFADVLGVSEDKSNQIYYAVVIVCAIIGMYLLFVRFSELKPKEDRAFLLTSSERKRSVFFNVVMLVYLGIVFIQYIQSFISTNS